FYDALFKARPETRQLFTGDMGRQRQHLAAALTLMVKNLRMLDALEQPLAELGAAHARVGVLPEHYPIVCDAMCDAIAEVAGAAWTTELSNDWHALLQLISRHMLAGCPEQQPLS